MKGIMKKLHIMLLCVVLVGATMGFHTGEVIVKAKSKLVAISNNCLGFDWDEFGTKSVIIKCDYACKVETMDYCANRFVTLSKTKLNAGVNTLKITVSKDKTNPHAEARTEIITIKPIMNGVGNEEYAKTIVVKQKGHGYKDVISNKKTETKGGWARDVGIYSFNYLITYDGYFKEMDGGKRRQFGKHEIYYRINSSVKNVPYVYYDPNTIVIKGTKQDSDKKVKNKYEYTMRTEYPGNYILKSGDELHTCHKACYKKLTVDKNTDKKVTASFMVHTKNGYSHSISISTSLNKSKEKR